MCVRWLCTARNRSGTTDPSEGVVTVVTHCTDSQSGWGSWLEEGSYTKLSNNVWMEVYDKRQRQPAVLWNWKDEAKRHISSEKWRKINRFFRELTGCGWSNSVMAYISLCYEFGQTHNRGRIVRPSRTRYHLDLYSWATPQSANRCRRIDT